MPREPKPEFPADNSSLPSAGTEDLAIARYLLGDEAATGIQGSLANDPAQESLAALRDWWAAGPYEAAEQHLNTEAALNHVLMRTEPRATPSRYSASRTVPATPGWFARLRPLAAVTITGLVAAGVYFVTRSPGNAPDDRPVAYHTQAGQHATVTLSDGSVVQLAPSTTLDMNGRTVTLQGQALFTVTPDAQAPFVVLANGVRTTVLGTEFGVRAYDNTVIVAVRSGRVAVRDRVSAQGSTGVHRAGDYGIVLGANDLATVTDDRVAVTRQGSVDTELAFARGELVLERVPLGEAVGVLNRWFDADVRIADPALAAKLLTATYRAGTVRDLADLLSMTFNARAELSGRVLTLTSR